MELGNLLWGHSRGMYLINRDFQDRFCKMLISAGYDTDGVKEKNEVCPLFVVRPYCWDDDSPDCLLPNFECAKLKLAISWYKYPLRDSYSNRRFTERIMKKLEELAKVR